MPELPPELGPAGAAPDELLHAEGCSVQVHMQRTPHALYRTGDHERVCMTSVSWMQQLSQASAFVQGRVRRTRAPQRSPPTPPQMPLGD